MATTSPFDPHKVDPEFYSQDPNQHGDSDFGRESEGVGTNLYSDATSGVDTDDESVQYVRDTRDNTIGIGRLGEPKAESLGGTQEWDVEADARTDVPKGELMSDEAARRLKEIAENPSDDALLHRADATYLEEGDNPSEGYDPHHVGYSNTDEETK